MLSKKVIYAACSLPGWVDMAHRLYRECNWLPCYWIGRPQVAQSVRERFPGIVFHDQFEAIRGMAPAECRDLDLPALDDDLLRRFSSYESIVLKMMDRVDHPSQLTHSDRRRLYYSLLRYWLAVIDRYKPDIMFNVSTPHQIYDYILYLLCRERGIKTILIGIAFDLRLVFCKANYEEGSGAIASIYWDRLAAGAGKGQATLSPASEASLMKVKGIYSNAIPPQISSQLEVERQVSSAGRKRVLRHIPAYTKHAGAVAFGFISRSGEREKMAQMSLSKLKSILYQDVIGPARTVRLRRYYESLAQDVDLSQPYIYIPLSYQPELSSSPEGDLFVEQHLMVDLLSKAVPPDWLVYVKEHPIQFTFTMGTNRCVRSHTFYDDLASLPNVRLVPFSVTPFDLIDSAQAVATVTGTSGWEALVRGKPVMYFGYPWWQGCEGSFYTPNLAACEEVISKVQAGYKVDHKKVHLFVQAVEEESCSGELYFNRELQILSSEQNAQVAEFAQDMAKLVQRFYRSNWPADSHERGHGSEE